jgi:hypothetical protein
MSQKEKDNHIFIELLPELKRRGLKGKLAIY